MKDTTLIMPPSSNNHHFAHAAADAILDGFAEYKKQFDAITQLARTRFEQRDWHGMRADAAERIELYQRVVDSTVAQIHARLGARLQEKDLWRMMRPDYAAAIQLRQDREIAETFFNSITRRIFSTVGVDPNIEFVHTDFDAPPTNAQPFVTRVYAQLATAFALAEKLLADYRFEADYQDLTRDTTWIMKELAERLESFGGWCDDIRVEMCNSVFFRDKRAYIIGAINTSLGMLPLVLALTHSSQGIVVDAVLTDEDDVSILFSFARSYFHAQAERPHALVHFLHKIMPLKRIAELYISIGYHKQGKTELYRDFLHHLKESSDQFEITPGDRGMVMVVFALPSYDIVFKVFRDHFADPKTATQQNVMDKYNLVFKHDRAGRLVDAQEFEHLEINRARFSDKLLDELRHLASQSVVVEDHHVHIRHAYIERRVTPLNLYLHQATDAAARAAVVDYGNAIKDLAASNIFPGDILQKNFGVTRHGRIVFYDYDELCFVTDCRFNPMPQARDEDEEMSGEAWFYVSENEVFPVEFRTFLGLGGELRDVFVAHHGDLFEVDFWRDVQSRNNAGEVIDIMPYDPSKQLARKYSS